MKKKKKIFIFLFNLYSKILAILFLIVIIFSGFLYFDFSSKVNLPPKPEKQIKIDSTKLESILNKISQKEKDYYNASQKVYRDIFK